MGQSPSNRQSLSRFSYSEATLRAFCQRAVPLNALSEMFLDKLFSRAQVHNLHAGQRLFELDVYDGKHIFLLEGDVDLQFTSGLVDTVQANTTVTNFPLAHVQPRHCRAIAVTECVILLIESEWIDQCLAWSQVLHAQADVVPSHFVRVLSSQVFNSIAPSNVIDIVKNLREIPVKAGEQLCLQGDVAHCAYFVVEGSARVQRSSDGSVVFTAALAAGDCFAEEVLRGTDTHNADLMMLSDGHLVALDRQAFNLLRLQRQELQATIAELTTTKDTHLLIDVRTRGEYLKAHLPNGLSIPLTELNIALSQLPTDKTLVFYCNTGRRAAAAYRMATDKGLQAATLSEGTDDHSLAVILEAFNPIGFVNGVYGAFGANT